MSVVTSTESVEKGKSNKCIGRVRDMRVSSKLLGSLLCAVAFAVAASQVSAQVINGGFETASGAYTTGALGWINTSGVPGNVTGSASRTTVDPFAGVAELTLSLPPARRSTGPGLPNPERVLSDR